MHVPGAFSITDCINVLRKRQLCSCLQKHRERGGRHKDRDEQGRESYFSSRASLIDRQSLGKNPNSRALNSMHIPNYKGIYDSKLAVEEHLKYPLFRSAFPCAKILTLPPHHRHLV